MQLHRRLNGVRADTSHLRHSLFSGAVGLLAPCMTLMSVLWSLPAFSADLACRFKTDTDPVEVQVFLGGKEHWRDKIQKGEIRTVSIPEGSFTIISKVYNPNLKTTEEFEQIPYEALQTTGFLSSTLYARTLTLRSVHNIH